MRQYLLYGQYLLYALLYCFEPPLETIQCKLASVNNLCWWLIENNWTWIRATYQLLFDLQHRLIMHMALQFHSLIPWSRTLFQYTIFVSWIFRPQNFFSINFSLVLAFWFCLIRLVDLPYMVPWWLDLWRGLGIPLLASIPQLLYNEPLSTPNAYNGVALYAQMDRTTFYEIKWRFDTISLLMFTHIVFVFYFWTKVIVWLAINI